QLMPLLQLDGYYILMDWLEIPNLRKRALAFVRYDVWAKLWRRQKINREERIFAVFGVLAAVYTAFAVFSGLNFWWHRANGIIQDALRVQDFATLRAAAFLLLLLIPFTLGTLRRMRTAAQLGFRALQRTSGVGRVWLH